MQFLNHIERNKLLNASDKVLLAVSGGVDSMVMLHLFLNAGFNIGVAHCNFQLRGIESFEEEELVRDYCEHNSIAFHLERFPTKEFADQTGASIQIAARQLRYDFFQKICGEHNYTRIATAHHLNDSLETFLINLCRGSGLEGFTGIPVVNGNIIRPLLFATRAEVVEFATANNVPWRNDSSNSSDDYARNVLRHKVIPVLKEVNPALEETFKDTLARMSESKIVLQRNIEQFRISGVHEDQGRLLIAKTALLETGTPALFLWEYTKALGFRYDQITKVIETSVTGKRFLSKTHTLLIDRDHFVIAKNNPDVFEQVEIPMDSINIRGVSGQLHLEEKDRTETISKDPSIAFIDRDKLTFPLRWRRWKEGDYFYPLGMRGKKKISDFLIDQKMDRLRKDCVTVLESSGEIIWVVGLRISENVKVTDSSRRILKIRWIADFTGHR